jgi:hypothetical protein
MKVRFGIILLPLLLPFIYASAQLHGKDTSSKTEAGFSSVKKERIGLKASLYALAHAHIEKQRGEKQLSTTPSIELVAHKSSMPRKNPIANAPRSFNRSSSRKMQRENTSEQPRDSVQKAHSQTTPSIKRQTKSFSLNKA